VRLTRKLGARERTEAVSFVVGQQEHALTPWPELAEARARFGASWDGMPLSANEAALLDSLCRQSHGAAAERLLDGILSAARGFVQLDGFPDDARLALAGAPVPVLRCRGRVWIGLARGDGDTVLTLDGGRALTIRASDRAAGMRKLATRVTFTTKDARLRYRVVGSQEWNPLGIPLDVPPTTREIVVDLARPMEALQPQQKLTPAVGEDIVVDVAPQDTGVRADAVAWSELQERRRTGFWLFTIPASLAVLGGGAVGGGAFMNGRAQLAAAAYEAATTRAEAETQRSFVEARIGFANLLTQIGVVTVGVAAASTALPALWLFAWNPDAPSPPEFPTE
jgi:hypothetical protein